MIRSMRTEDRCPQLQITEEENRAYKLPKSAVATRRPAGGCRCYLTCCRDERHGRKDLKDRVGEEPERGERLRSRARSGEGPEDASSPVDAPGPHAGPGAAWVPGGGGRGQDRGKQVGTARLRERGSPGQPWPCFTKTFYHLLRHLKNKHYVTKSILRSRFKNQYNTLKG